MDIQVLGPLRVVTSEGEEIPLGGPKPRAVLALLASSPGVAIDTDALVEELWPDAEAASGRKTVQAYVSRLRTTFAEHGAPDAIRPRGTGYALDPSLSTDAARFEGSLAEAEPLVHDRPAEAARSLREAIGLWRGRPFEDAHPTRRLELEAARLEERGFAAREAWAEAQLALGRDRELIAELRRLAAEDPLRERPWAMLMLALYRQGRQAEALAIYPDVARRLRDELGVEPSEELSELQARILRQDPSLALPRQSPPPSAATASPRSIPEARRPRAPWAALAGVLMIPAALAVVAGLAWAARPATAPVRTLRADTRLEVPTGATTLVGSGETLWLAAADDPALYALAPAGGEAVRHELPAVPSAVAAGLGAIWVASEAAGVVWRIDPGTGRVSGTTKALDLSEPAIAVGPDAVWVIRHHPRSFLRLDPVSLETETLPFIDGFGGPAAPDLTLVGGRLWASNSFIGRVMWLDPTTDEFGFAGDARIAHHAARSILADRGAAWFSQPTHGSVTRVDPGTGAVTATVVLGRTSGSGFGEIVAPYALAGGPGGLWVAMPDDGAVALLDDATGSEVARLPLGRPEAIAATVGGGVWVLDARANEVLHVDPGSCTPLPFIGRGADLRGCDLSSKVLVGIDLNGADLRWADLRMTAAQQVDFSGADLLGADLEGTSLEGATWRATRCPDGSMSEQHSGSCPAQ